MQRNSSLALPVCYNDLRNMLNNGPIKALQLRLQSFLESEERSEWQSGGLSAEGGNEVSELIETSREPKRPREVLCDD